jgi:two-component system, NarL family, nitrate/nitrite response regulator NarL
MGLHGSTISVASPARRTRVMVADPYPVILLGLRTMLEDDPRFHVIAEVSNMPSVWKSVLAEQPEVALIDWCSASQNLENTRALLQSDLHSTSIIFLTSSDDWQQKSEGLRLGARGFLSKWCSAEEIRAAVWSACRVPVSHARAAGRPSDDSVPAYADNEAARRVKYLTKREREILPLVCSGLKNKEIATELGISESTVWHHLTAVFTKLQVEDRLGLAAFAYSHRLVYPGFDSQQEPN